MSMILPILLLALAGQSLPAPAAVHWEDITTDIGARISIDPASLQRDGDRVRFIIRNVAGQPGADDGAAVAVLRSVVDCRRHEAALEAIDLYGADGHFLQSPPVEAPGMHAIGDDPGGLAMYRRVCEAGAAAPQPAPAPAPAH